MSLAQIVYPAATPSGFEEWSFAHYQHHLAIIGAAASVRQVKLTLYQIWPFSSKNSQEWLLQHQQQHNDMNSLYRVSGSDLSSLDFNDKKQLDAWFNLHFNEHRDVGAVCGVAI